VNVVDLLVEGAVEEAILRRLVPQPACGQVGCGDRGLADGRRQGPGGIPADLHRHRRGMVPRPDSGALTAIRGLENSG